MGTIPVRSFPAPIPFDVQEGEEELPTAPRPPSLPTLPDPKVATVKALKEALNKYILAGAGSYYSYPDWTFLT